VINFEDIVFAPWARGKGEMWGFKFVIKIKRVKKNKEKLLSFFINNDPP
jgi:hypothetical protein